MKVAPHGAVGVVCSMCASHARRERCSACGALRPISVRNPDTTSTCRSCNRRNKAELVRDANRGVIVDAVGRAEPQLGLSVISAAVDSVCDTTRRLNSLAAALREDPDCLINASGRAPREADRLVSAMTAAGATRLRLPSCAVCAKTPPTLIGRTGQRLCPSCNTKKRVETCSGCGVEMPVVGRAADGGALCWICVRRDPSHQKLCSICAKPGHITARRDGQAICVRCYGRPHRTCEGCGRTAPTSGGRDRPRLCSACRPPRRETICAYCAKRASVSAIWAAGPACSTCYQRTLASKGTCEGCGQLRRIDPRDTSNRALCSDCAGLPPLAVCEGCGGEDRIWRNRRCFACNLDARLDVILAGPQGGIPDHLASLRAGLAGTESPRAVLRWLDEPRVEAVLCGLAAGTLVVDHATLDDIGGSSAWMGHLRQVLVNAGVLAGRDETVAALQRWVDAQLDKIGDPEDRNLVAAYATWWVIRRRRSRQASRPADDTGYDHTAIARAIELLAWLRNHELTLGSCTQADIDLWLASGPPARRHARRFIRWARRQHLCQAIDIVRRRDPVPAPAADVKELAATARRLLADDTIALADRVAGLLVILYGQPLTRVAALEEIHVAQHGKITTLRLGVTPIELPEPFGQLVRQLVATRRSHAALADHAGRWLFPGGRPGRHIGADQLETRLNRIGIRARATRTTMLLEHATQLAPAVIADMLGLSPNTAVRWVKAAAGDWNAYAAMRAHSG